MNKYRYLDMLSNNISSELPADEYNNVMQYYTEYFADAGIEKEEDVIKKLGSPEELAIRIIAEYKGKNPSELKAEQPKKKGLSVGWIIFIAIIGSPLWLALLCVALGVAMAAFGCIAAICGCAIGLTLGGIFTVFGGVALLFAQPSTGILVIGTGFLFAAAGIGFILLSVLIISSIVKGCMAASKNSAKKKKRRA